MIGVRPDGTKELITVEDGYRESAESWKTVLRDLKRRGMRPRVVAVGDGALGFWVAGARRVAKDPRAVRLVPQAREHPRQAPEAAAASGEGRAPRDHVRRIGFMDGVQQEGKVNRTKAKAA
jgi:hypothetical protein